MTTAVVDIETDSLDASRIHCIVAQHYKTGEMREWVGDQCKEFGQWSKKIDTFIMHNGLSFDAPILNKLTGSKISSSQVRDTLLESQLFNPIRDGGHSLKAWGKELNYHKFDYDDFNHFTLEMLDYCKQDVALTRKVAQRLELEGTKFSKKSYELERDVRVRQLIIPEEM